MSNELIHYLNSGVKVKHNCYISDLDVFNLNQIVAEHSTAQIYLYPLSCLTKPIPIDGEMKIPLVELVKIEGTYKGEEYEILRDIMSWKITDGNEWLFRYSPTYNSFFKSCEGVSYTSTNQLTLFQKMFEWKINVFPDKIKSIDPRELEDGNPYKI